MSDWLGITDLAEQEKMIKRCKVLEPIRRYAFFDLLQLDAANRFAECIKSIDLWYRKLKLYPIRTCTTII